MLRMVSDNDSAKCLDLRIEFKELTCLKNCIVKRTDSVK